MTLQSKPNTDDVRIREIKELVPPAHVFREFPVGVRAAASIAGVPSPSPIAAARATAIATTATGGTRPHDTQG